MSKGLAVFLAVLAAGQVVVAVGGPFKRPANHEEHYWVNRLFALVWCGAYAAAAMELWR